MSLTTYACEILTKERIAGAWHESEQERAAQRLRKSGQTGGQPRPQAIWVVTWLGGVEPHA